jgi:hypothetical protein
MTMILAGGIGDKRLTTCLGQLFKEHPSFESLRNLDVQGIRQLLGAKKDGGIGLGFVNPDAGGNGARLWNFKECYFGPWKEKITEDNILILYHKNGFGGGKFVRTLQAYCCGNKDVLPLDKPALRALRDPLFPEYLDNSDDEIRRDIEV